MKEIRFRAWVKSLKRFYNITGFMEKTDPTHGYKVISLFFGDGFGSWARDDVILNQYSGLQDREKKDIYEGDIVSLRYWHNNPPSKRPKKKFITVHLPVIFLDGEFKPDIQAIRSTKYGTSYGHWYDNCAVIGNIYENPDLLKQSTNG